MKVKEYIDRIDREDLCIHINSGELLEEECFRSVLLISHELTRTGAPLQLLQLTDVLIELGYKPFVYSISGGNAEEDFISRGVVTICGTGNTDNADWVIGLADFFDTIFINTLILASYVRLLAPRAKRTFWWIHESSFVFDKVYCGEIPDTPSFSILAASHVVSEHVKHYLDRDALLLNVSVNDYGRSVPGIKKDHEKIVFLWAGVIYYVKALDVLLEAILDLEAEYMSRIEFWIIGRSSQENEYTGLAEKFAESFSNVFFWETVPHDDLMRLMDEADSVVVTSLEETTSMMAVEGMMKSKIVICSDGCGVTRYITDKNNGLIFKTGDHEGLSRKIKYVVDNYDDLDDMRCRARKVYDMNYSSVIFKKSLSCILENAGTAAE